MTSDVAARAPRRPVAVARIVGAAVLVAMVGFGVYGLSTLDVTWARLVRGYGKAEEIFHKNPIAFPTWPDALYLTGLTVGIVVLGTLLAALLSIPVAWMSAGNTAPNAAVRWVGRAIGVLTRSVPDIVLALAFSISFSLGSPLPGILAFGIHSVGMISKLYADAIESSDPGPRLAIRAAGGSRAQEFWSGVFPQVIPSWIATTLFRFDINLRSSAILGYAGVGGLGYALANYFHRFNYGRAIGIAIILLVLCIVLEIASSTIRRQLLGVTPSGNSLGNRIVRAATRGRPAPPARIPAARIPPGAAVTVEGMLRRPWTGARVANLGWALLAVALVVASWFWAHVDLNQIRWSFIRRTVVSFWPPTFGTYGFATFGQALLITVEVAFAGTVLAVVASVLFGALAARNVAPNGLVRGIFRVVLTVIRAVPELVLAVFMIMVSGLGNQAAVVVLAFAGIGLLGKLVGDSYEEVPAGPERALAAVGATRAQRFFSATWPQGLPALLSNSLYLIDTNLRAATILSFVGGGGIGYYLSQAASEETLHPEVPTLVLMVMVAVLIVEGVAQWLRSVFR